MLAAVQQDAFRQALRRDAATSALLERELRITDELLTKAGRQDRVRLWGCGRALESYRALLSHALDDVGAPTRRLRP